MGKTDIEAFRAARDFLLANRTDYAAAYDGFAWPRLTSFNWARDWFDDVLAVEQPDQTALWIVEEDGSETKLSFADMSARSSQVAGWLRSEGVRRGDRILLMLGNQVELWETLLAAIKLGAVVIPASTLLTTADLADRVDRGDVAHVVARTVDVPRFSGVEGGWTRIAVGEPVEGWLRYDDSYTSLADSSADGPTGADDPLLLYFTSGTTAQPKLVEHTHTSLPGRAPVDHVLDRPAPRRRAPEHLVAGLGQARLEQLLRTVERRRDHPDREPGPVQRRPACWRPSCAAARPRSARRRRCGGLLIQADLAAVRVPIRECVGGRRAAQPGSDRAGPAAWGITIRDGYGQTETTAQIGNPPGQPLKPGRWAGRCPATGSYWSIR